MFDTLCLEFDYSEEAFDRLEKVFELEKEKLLCTYENSLEFIKNDRKNYLEEKKNKITQGKSIRINRKQQSNKWNKLKLVYFQNNLQIKMHPSQSAFLLKIVEKHYLNKIKSIYADEDSPYDKIQAHEYFRQKPITFSNDDISFLEYEFSSKNGYALYINKHPYLVWMGKNELVQRDESGKPIWNSDRTEFQYRYTDCFIIVQRFYNGFYWVVSSYEANDSRQDKKQQAVKDMIDMIGQKSGAKTIEQIAKELHEYMWLTPTEIQSLLSLAALRYVSRYNNKICKALNGQELDKPRSGIAQQEFSNPLTMLIRYP